MDEEFNQRLIFFFSESNHLVESENGKIDIQVQDFDFSYTQYENILSNKYEIEVEESPPNAKKYFSQHDKVENVASGL